MAADDAETLSEGVSSPLSSIPSSALSSPLSSPANSPSPPPEMPAVRQYVRASYLPSPPSSQSTSQTGSPTPDGMDSGPNDGKDGPPPAKRRRISKERTSGAYLDLRNEEVEAEQQPEMDRLLKVLTKSQKVVVIAGAGISVSAGIPDFRSAGGLFRSLKEEHKLKGSGKHLFDASVYKDDNSTSSFHSMVSSMSRLTREARPTDFHHMLATIAKEDRLLRLYSQNVDGIDTSLEPLKTCAPLRKDQDGKWPRTVQLHGGLDKMVCTKCHELSDFDADLFDGPDAPLCPRCEEINDIRTNHEGKRSHGIGRLRPRMVLYNEHNPDDLAIGAVTREDLRRRPDAVIVAGTTLKVPGVRRIVREMCGVVRDRRGGVAIWINNDPPPVAKDLEDCFDIIIQGPCDEVARHAAMRKWYEPEIDDNFSEVSDDEARKASSQAEVEVHIPCPLTHANLMALPSQRHFNNSFKVPELNCTPKKELPSPGDWSPITERSQSIHQSIETEAHSDTIAVTPTGLLTPTKSSKGSPAKNIKPLQLALKDNGGKKKPGPKPGVPAKGKRPNVKFVKPPLSQSKPNQASKAVAAAAGKKVKPGPKPKNQKPAASKPAGSLLTNSFKASKSGAEKAKDKVQAKVYTSGITRPTPSPSKLRQMSNASQQQEPMQTVPEKDARVNLSPSKAGLSPSKARGAVFPGLMKENPTNGEKESVGRGMKRGLSVAELTS